ncbi:MAG: M48 family metalloprotease [Thermodesulfobacteriota bacterium]
MRLRRRGMPLNYRPNRMRSRRGGKGRLLIGLVVAAFALISYFSSKEYNPLTGEDQYISITPKQEIALGLQSTPQMIKQHGGLYPDQELQNLVDAVGNKLLQNNQIQDTPWEFEFHLLADPNTINAFALPGGQVFITAALFSKFKTEGQLAGVLGHEIGHVVARHSAQRIAKSQLTEGLTGAVVAASGSAGSAQMAAMVGQLVNMKYGREDELQSDSIGVLLMSEAGYDPRSMVGVMEILAKASKGNRQPEFFSTHPNPENRVQKIKNAIDKVYPDGVPAGLKP